MSKRDQSFVERIELRLRRGDKAKLTREFKQVQKAAGDTSVRPTSLMSLSAYIRWKLGLKP
jgi:uncharacterized protein YeeX (DUF496 family)